MKRILFDIVLILSLFWMPWYVTGILAFSGMFIFPHFYEFLGVSVVMYALFAKASVVHSASPVWFSISVSGIYIGIQVLRKYLIIYTTHGISH